MIRYIWRIFIRMLGTYFLCYNYILLVSRYTKEASNPTLDLLKTLIFSLGNK